MRQTLARWLRRWAEWLDPVDPLLMTARAVVRETEGLQRRGPYKAARALTLLRRAYPGVKESRLKWAIETVVQELP